MADDDAPQTPPNGDYDYAFDTPQFDGDDEYDSISHGFSHLGFDQHEQSTLSPEWHYAEDHTTLAGGSTFVTDSTVHDSDDYRFFVDRKYDDAEVASCAEYPQSMTQQATEYSMVNLHSSPSPTPDSPVSQECDEGVVYGGVRHASPEFQEMGQHFLDENPVSSTSYPRSIEFIPADESTTARASRSVHGSHGSSYLEESPSGHGQSSDKRDKRDKRKKHEKKKSNVSSKQKRRN